MSGLPPPIVALTPGTLGGNAEGPGAAIEELRARIAAALAGGLRGVLLREPALHDRDFLALARELRAALGPKRWLGVHDRVHLALVAHADAVHVGFRSLPVDALREWCGDRLVIGSSTHAGDDPALSSGADYLFHGPVRDTPSKHGLVAPIGIEGLARAVRASALPVLGLGGLRPEDAPRVRATGAAGMAVLAGILPDPDPAQAARAYLTAWEAAR